MPVVIALVGFFVAFNVLEALQPSLVSRVAPPDYKGLALGFYNTAQSLGVFRSEEHTSELQSLMRNSYAVFCLTKKNIYLSNHDDIKHYKHAYYVSKNTNEPKYGIQPI